LLELSSQRPETVFHTVSQSRGLEAVEQVRLATTPRATTK
jgi:hypothetical protein